MTDPDDCDRDAAADRLVLAPSVREELASRAREGARYPPEEVCGVLLGERGNDEWCATGSRPIPNVADRPRVAYELDPAATVAAIDAIEASDRDVLGFYHSHPEGSSEPSRTDRERASWPGYCYLVVGFPDGPDAAATLGAWRWTGESFVRTAVGSADAGTIADTGR